ncbi:hypothetical protein ACFQGF_17580 [Microbulbifer taiwanensis]
MKFPAFPPGPGVEVRIPGRLLNGKSTINGNITMGISRLHLVLCLSLFWQLSVQAQEADVVYVPSVAYHIESIVEVGIEKQGSYNSLITTSHGSSASTTSNSASSSEDSRETTTAKTRKKTTNPKKRATRPKASGLFGGIARAFGGDFSGLAEWGGNFVDHMAEPRYNWDVAETYSTKENAKTTASQSIATAWTNSSQLSAKITEELKYDINKGFISFSVNVRNIGERTIRITEPSFVIHLELEGGGKSLVGNTELASGQGSLITVAPGENYSIPVRVRNLDFLSLSDKYRNSTGIIIKLQDLRVQHGAELLAVSEVKERLRKTHVQLDYFDGQRRTVRYIKIPQSGIGLRDFYPEAFANKNYRLNENATTGNDRAPYIQSVSGLHSSSQTFDAMRTASERYSWRRWFTSVVDDNGQVFDASLDSSIFPGYEVKVGYYGAKDILPPSKYRPVVYSNADVDLNSDALIHIPLRLQPGDIIEFTDLSFGDRFLVNEVRLEFSAVSQEQVSAPAATGGGFGVFSFSTPFDVWVQRMLQGEGTGQGGFFSFAPAGGGHFEMIPRSSRLVNINPKHLMVNRMDEFSFSNEDALLFLRNFQVMGLKDRFVHYRYRGDDLKVGFQPSTMHFSNVGGRSVSMEDVMEGVGMMLRPGESVDDFIMRMLDEGEYFRYQVTESVEREDNYWRFAMPKNQLKASYIRLQDNQANPQAQMTGYLLGNGYSVMPVHIVGQPPMGAAMPWGMAGNFAGSGIDERNLLYVKNLDSPFTILRESGGRSLTLSSNIGSPITGTLQVIRY